MARGGKRGITRRITQACLGASPDVRANLHPVGKASSPQPKLWRAKPYSRT